MPSLCILTVNTCSRQQRKTLRGFYGNTTMRKPLRGCHGNATMRSLCILIVDLSVVVNSVKPLGVAMETQNCAPALLSSYKTFRTAINNT